VTDLDLRAWLTEQVERSRRNDSGGRDDQYFAGRADAYDDVLDRLDEIERGAQS
jgi:hypothetical protein